jgi:hypothetical protein
MCDRIIASEIFGHPSISSDSHLPPASSARVSLLHLSPLVANPEILVSGSNPVWSAQEKLHVGGQEDVVSEPQPLNADGERRRIEKNELPSERRPVNETMMGECFGWIKRL